MQNAMLVSIFRLWSKIGLNMYKFGPINRSCQFKLKIGTQTNSNMKNSKVMFIFFCFRPEVYFFLELYSKNQNCLLKLKFRIQINLNKQNSMEIFMFLVPKYSFCVNLIQKFKRVILRQNLLPTLECLIDGSHPLPPLISFSICFHLEHSFSTPPFFLPHCLLIIGESFQPEFETIFLC